MKIDDQFQYEELVEFWFDKTSGLGTIRVPPERSDTGIYISFKLYRKFSTSGTVQRVFPKEKIKSSVS